jgi:hypothetical protein
LAPQTLQDLRYHVSALARLVRQLEEGQATTAWEDPDAGAD